MKKKLVGTVLALGLSTVLLAQKKKVPPPPPPPPAPAAEHQPPPPPPPPPPPKVIVSSYWGPSKGKNVPADYAAFLKRNTHVKYLAWSGKGNIVEVHLKNGSVEPYDTQVPEELQEVERKYGKLPKAPPPPPAKREVKERSEQ